MKTDAIMHTHPQCERSDLKNCLRLPLKYIFQFSTISFLVNLLRWRPRQRKACLSRGWYIRSCNQSLVISFIPPLAGNTRAKITKIKMAKRVILLLAIVSVVCSLSSSLQDEQDNEEPGTKIL